MPLSIKKKLFPTRSSNSTKNMVEAKKESDWYFVQVKGKLQESEVLDNDVITCVVFNHDGKLLATGDKGGRVVVFQKSDTTADTLFKDEYNVYATFQSHEPDFDYLKSVEIEEKINKICWLGPCNNSHFLLTTNDKTVKLFKISDKVPYSSASTITSRSSSFKETDQFIHAKDSSSPISSFRRQSSYRGHPIRNGKCRISYPNAHQFNIHSISSCSDRDFFLSADDLRVNLWNLERNDTCFTIVDARPESMEDLSEVITCCQFHPHDSSIFLYSTSRGSIKLCDTRIRSVCDSPAAIFEEVDSPSIVSLKFSEVVRSISDLHFAPNPRYFTTRNYLEVKIWDVNMTKGPIESYVVQDYINSDSKLNEMYESDAIFDKFESRMSPDSKSIVSGSYGNLFNITRRGSNDLKANQDFYEANCDLIFPITDTRPKLPKKHIINTDMEQTDSRKKRKDDIPLDHIRFSRRICTMDWHPTENIIAMGAHQNLYLFSQNIYV